MTAHERFDKGFAGLPMARRQPLDEPTFQSGPNPIEYLLGIGLLRGETRVPADEVEQEPERSICGVGLHTATLQAMASRLDRFVATKAPQHGLQPLDDNDGANGGKS